MIRFYESILKLPMPKGLTAEEQVQYAKLIDDQITPYKSRAAKLNEEIDKLLTENFIDKYIEVARNEEVSHGLLKWEVNQLNLVINDKSQKIKMVNLLNLIKISGKKKLLMVSENSDKVVKNIYMNLRSEPFNRDYLNKFLDLEKI